MITIIDYGLGNIQAFVNVYKRLNIPVAVAKQPSELERATRLILPGVGAFDHAMERLNASGMRPSLEQLVREQRMPVLGICVGMQMLASASDEGCLPGLGWVNGRVKAFAAAPELKGLPLPHMGWNDVQSISGSPLFRGLEEEARFYFLHSFYFDCEGGAGGIASACYGHKFDCAVSEGNVFGVQFHPEKSHHFGTTLLKNFAEF
jgi:glutamine amidotransferase